MVSDIQDAFVGVCIKVLKQARFRHHTRNPILTLQHTV